MADHDVEAAPQPKRRVRNLLASYYALDNDGDAPPPAVPGGGPPGGSEFDDAGFVAEKWFQKTIQHRSVQQLVSVPCWIVF